MLSWDEHAFTTIWAFVSPYLKVKSPLHFAGSPFRWKLSCEIIARYNWWYFVITHWINLQHSYNSLKMKSLFCNSTYCSKPSLMHLSSWPESTGLPLARPITAIITTKRRNYSIWETVLLGPLSVNINLPCTRLSPEWIEKRTEPAKTTVTCRPGMYIERQSSPIYV